MTTEATTEAPEAKPKVTPKKSANNGTKVVAPVAPAAPPAAVVEEEAEDVMDLTSLVPTRKLIKLPMEGNPEGEAFELRLLDDFGIIEQQKLLNWSRRFEKLWNKEDDEDLTEEEQTSLKWLLDQMFDKVLVAPAEVKEKIPDYVRSRVVTAFTLVPLLARQEAEMKAQEKAEKEAEEAKVDDRKAQTSGN